MVKAKIKGKIQFAWRTRPQPLTFRIKRKEGGTYDINFGKDSNEVWLDLEKQFGKKLLEELFEKRFQDVPIEITIG
mgnify:CR=1 FL=1